MHGVCDSMKLTGAAMLPCGVGSAGTRVPVVLSNASSDGSTLSALSPLEALFVQIIHFHLL